MHSTIAPSGYPLIMFMTNACRQHKGLSRVACKIGWKKLKIDACSTLLLPQTSSSFSSSLSSSLLATTTKTTTAAEIFAEFAPCVISGCHFWLPLISRVTPLFKLFRYRTSCQSRAPSPLPPVFFFFVSLSVSVRLSVLACGWSAAFWQLPVRIHATR